MSQTVVDQPNSLWMQLVEASQDYHQALRKFLSAADRLEILRQALRSKDRDTALGVAQVLSPQEKQQLLPEWVHLARSAHGPFETAWNILLSLPRDRILPDLEKEVDRILQNEEEDDYWMFLQLYDKFDRDLTIKLARRAAAHSNPDIVELGQEYLQSDSGGRPSADGSQ